MPVYPVAAGTAASCASPGCWCRDRRPCHPSGLTDDQWAVLEPRAREVMSELTVAVGRPTARDLRAMCDAVSYVVKNGAGWRALPPASRRGSPRTRSSSAPAERWGGARRRSPQQAALSTGSKALSIMHELLNMPPGKLAAVGRAAVRVNDYRPAGSPAVELVRRPDERRGARPALQDRRGEPGFRLQRQVTARQYVAQTTDAPGVNAGCVPGTAPGVTAPPGVSRYSPDCRS
jgi:transposase